MNCLFLSLGWTLLAVTPAVAPVHVTMKTDAAVAPDAAGFFLLAGVADLTGGNAVLRARLAQIEIGRAPMPGNVRHLTRGDLALKLRQAGYQPGRDAVLEGSAAADVTVAGQAAPPVAPSISAPEGVEEGNGAGAGGPLIHRGDTVTICINDDVLNITAKGIARENGAVGDTIHVHRDGCMTDLAVTVVDAQTVQLEP